LRDHTIRALPVTVALIAVVRPDKYVFAPPRTESRTLVDILSVVEVSGTPVAGKYRRPRPEAPTCALRRLTHAEVWYGCVEVPVPGTTVVLSASACVSSTPVCDRASARTPARLVTLFHSSVSVAGGVTAAHAVAIAAICTGLMGVPKSASVNTGLIDHSSPPGMLPKTDSLMRSAIHILLDAF
jgi:hypothetical protein